MRIFVTGAGGFVGRNPVHVFGERHGAEVLSPSHGELDVTDAAAVGAYVDATRPDAIVHAAIWNDSPRLLTDRRRAWTGYVGATRAVVDAANAAGAHVVLISTDWVFDGTQGPACEDTPPKPISHYGFLKMCSELALTERAARGTVARIAAVQGVHRARSSTIRAQDVGFGYLAASVLDALREVRSFTAWDDPRLNRLATLVLATDAAEPIFRALEREVTGTLDCVGAEHVDRVELARRAALALGFNAALVQIGPPPREALDGGIPVDTRLDGQRTAERLGVELPGFDAMLAGLREQLDASWSAA
jgi:dTDP-4-dehydrorhamnose reductase